VTLVICRDTRWTLQLTFTTALAADLVLEDTIFVEHLNATVATIGDDDVIVSADADKCRFFELPTPISLLTN